MMSVLLYQFPNEYRNFDQPIKYFDRLDSILIFIFIQLLYSLKIQMHHKQNTQQSIQVQKQSLRGKQKYKELLAHSKQYQTLCLNQSELKHMHAIRPYCSKQRKSSRRQSRHNQSPYEMSRSNSKRLENSNRKSQDGKIKKSSQQLVGNKQMSDMLSELINLKSEYKILKGNYTKILSQKQEEISQQQKQKKHLSQQLQKRIKQSERYQKSTLVLEQQIERIRKQCTKILQMERFKMKKLEQTLQQKELMIAFLRNELDNTKKGTENNQPLFFLQNSAGMLNFSYFNKPATNVSAMNNIMQCDPSKQLTNELHADEDSLTLSRDKSKEMDSIFHSFLSNSNDHFHQANFGKKQNIKLDSLQQSPIQVQIDVIEEKSEPSQKQIIDHKLPKQFKDCIEINKESIGIKSKIKSRKLQILISDENSDTQNVPQSLKEQVSMETKKKMSNSNMMCKQKKKLTAKKIKPI